jgi:hypothetical protein
MALTERSPEVIAFIRDALDLPTGSEIHEAANLHEMLSQDLSFQPDIILKAGGQFYQRTPGGSETASKGVLQ